MKLGDHEGMNWQNKYFKKDILPSFWDKNGVKMSFLPRFSKFKLIDPLALSDNECLKIT